MLRIRKKKQPLLYHFCQPFLMCEWKLLRKTEENLNKCLHRTRVTYTVLWLDFRAGHGAGALGRVLGVLFHQLHTRGLRGSGGHRVWPPGATYTLMAETDCVKKKEKSKFSQMQSSSARVTEAPWQKRFSLSSCGEHVFSIRLNGATSPEGYLMQTYAKLIHRTHWSRVTIPTNNRNSLVLSFYPSFNDRPCLFFRVFIKIQTENAVGQLLVIDWLLSIFNNQHHP